MKTEQLHWSATNDWATPLTEAKLRETASLVLVFADAVVETINPLLAQLRQAFPKAHVVGCTTAGGILDTKVTDETIVATAVEFEHTQLAVASRKLPSPEDSFACGEALGKDLDPDGLRHVFVLCEGIKIKASDFALGLTSSLPEGVTVSGGVSADALRLKETYVWGDGEPEAESAVAIGFYGDRLRIGRAATGVWGAFGPERIVTRSTGNTVYEFDGRSALAVYKQYLGEHADRLPVSGLMFPLYVRFPDREGCVLRTVFNTNEESQSVWFAGDVPVGSRTRLVMGNMEELIDGTYDAAQASLAPLDGHPAQWAVLVSCVGRRNVLQQRVEEEVETVGEVFGSSTPLTGFYSYGELAPAEGGSAEIHNQTMAITTFAEI